MVDKSDGVPRTSQIGQQKVMSVQRQVNWETRNEVSPRIGQTGLQKMSGFLRLVKLVDKK